MMALSCHVDKSASLPMLVGKDVPEITIAVIIALVPYPAVRDRLHCFLDSAFLKIGGKNVSMLFVGHLSFIIAPCMKLDQCMAKLAIVGINPITTKTGPGSEHMMTPQE